MSEPGLDRLFTHGFYGTLNEQMSTVATNGWYDSVAPGSKDRKDPIERANEEIEWQDIIDIERDI